jgi:hypothetical protein
MSREDIEKKGKFYNVIGGKFKVQVSKEHPEAEQRDYELKDGTKGTKFERTVDALFGKITDISFHDGDYGKNIFITLDENEDTGETPVISLSVATNYGEDALKKLPNINFSEDVRIRPYAWTPEDSDKERRGIEFTQKDSEGLFKKKVDNFFYDKDTKEPVNGYPTPDGDTKSYSSDDWKIFYLQARKFLVKYTEEVILPKFSQVKQPEKAIEYPTDDINPADTPF